jgi:hypothetical protein
MICIPVRVILALAMAQNAEQRQPAVFGPSGGMRGLPTVTAAVSWMLWLAEFNKSTS